MSFYLLTGNNKYEKLKTIEYTNGNKTWWSVDEKTDVLYKKNDSFYLNMDYDQRLFQKNKTGWFSYDMERFDAPLATFQPRHQDTMKLRILQTNITNIFGLE